MTIIVEGPDGGGKTTLISRLQREYGLPTLPRACTTLGGPVDDLAGWVDNSLHNLPLAGILDRYPLMSDYVYGPITRGYLSPRFADLTWSTVALHKLKIVDPLVIFCMPPIELVRTNVRGEVQMAGVVDHIDEIYAAYQSLISLYNVYLPHVMVYDYDKWRFDPDYQDWMHDQIETYRNRYPERFPSGSTHL